MHFAIHSVDMIEKGHILGSARNLTQKLVILQDRSIDRISVSLIRLLTHLSMFIGANIDNEVCGYDDSCSCFVIM